MKPTILYIMGLLVATILFQGCTKAFLDVKPRTDLIIPRTLQDLQQLLDNINIINTTGSLPQLSADEYRYVDESMWLASSVMERNAYVWAPDIYEGMEGVKDWSYPYTSIFYANSVIEQLKGQNLDRENDQDAFDYVLGWAFFARAFSTFDLVRNFCLPYDKETADQDVGIPLLLTPNIDETLPRASMKDCFEQILIDLDSAGRLLPPLFDQAKRNRPSKVAAYGLLARIYLYMGEYEQAFSYADRCLAMYDKLMDYSTVPLGTDSPFPKTNIEVLFSASQIPTNFTTAQSPLNTSIMVEPMVMQLFEEDDYRLQVFFGVRADGTYYKKQGYNESNYPFSGLATDEVYLIKAECLARMGLVPEALAALNLLLGNRYPKDSFRPIDADSAGELLPIILQERRKELVWRGIRWSDLKRLNKEGYGIGLQRDIGGNKYALPPNDPRWVFPIPDEEVTRSGIKQNAR